jgi:ACS family allantoate permease-like MFS transporter
MRRRWKTTEQPLRIALWYSGSAMGGIIGQAIDIGAVSLKGYYQYSPWKYIYIILGSVSIAFGILLIFIFPDSPMKARFLSERERSIAVQRIQANNTGIQTREFKKDQVMEAFKDPQMYLITIILFTFAFANSALGRYAFSHISASAGSGL